MDLTFVLLIVFGAAVVALAIHGAMQQAMPPGLDEGLERSAPSARDPDTPAARESEVRSYVRSRNEYLLETGRPPRDEDDEVRRLLSAQPVGEKRPRTSDDEARAEARARPAGEPPAGGGW